MMSGESDYKLPLTVFIQEVESKIISGTLKRSLLLTIKGQEEDFVEGYDLVSDCLWPLILAAFDTSLSFATSSGNLKLFHINYLEVTDFVGRLKKITSNAADL